MRSGRRRAAGAVEWFFRAILSSSVRLLLPGLHSEGVLPKEILWNSLYTVAESSIVRERGDAKLRAFMTIRSLAACESVRSPRK